MTKSETWWKELSRTKREALIWELLEPRRLLGLELVMQEPWKGVKTQQEDSRTHRPVAVGRTLGAS